MADAATGTIAGADTITDTATLDAMADAATGAIASTPPKVTDDLDIGIPVSGADAAATLTDILTDTAPVIDDTTKLTTPTLVDTIPIIPTTGDAPKVTDDLDIGIPVSGADAAATLTDILTDTAPVIDDTTKLTTPTLVDTIPTGPDVGETKETDVGTGVGVGTGVIGTGDIPTGAETETIGTDDIQVGTGTGADTGTDVVTGTGTDVVTGTGTDVVTGTDTDVVTGADTTTETGTTTGVGTEAIVDAAVVDSTIPTLPPPPILPAPTEEIPIQDPTEEEEEEEEEFDTVDQIRNILYGQQVKVEPSGVADIPDPYDFRSIFGNVGQQNRFTGTSPYGTTDLINFLRSIS